jgi:hypothetical protein
VIAKHRVATLGVLIVACGGLVAAASAAADTDVAKEVSTAAQHAGLAASSKDMKTTQMHLHHVVNWAIITLTQQISEGRMLLPNRDACYTPHFRRTRFFDRPLR